jgi:predicted DNA-binding transcriptional regulator YafY
MLLHQYPDGLKVGEIARKYSTSTKTIYRDLKSLESELSVPIWEKGSKRGLAEGYFLPPINFTSTEAINIFIAVRLMQRLFHQYNPSVASAFMKLITVVPMPLRKQIQNTLEYIEKQPLDKTKVRNFFKLTEAWLSQKRAKFCYRGVWDQASEERTVEPYFIEPVVWTHSNHIVAYCHLKKCIRTYNIDRIIGDVTICPETYEIPANFNAIDYLSSSWGIVQDQELIAVKLKFKPELTEAVTKTSWHPSQKMEIQEDGSIIMTLKTRNTVEFTAWILGWGNSVEVLEPKILRDQIIKTAQSILDAYRFEGVSGGNTSSIFYQRSKMGNTMKELTDGQWEAIKFTLPPPARTGRPRGDDRKNLNGILWVLRNRARWADVPRQFGAPSTCHYKLKSWQKQRIWENMRHLLGKMDYVV